MKTLKTAALISLLSICVTQSAFASWWNPFTWHIFNKKVVQVEQTEKSTQSAIKKTVNEEVAKEEKTIIKNVTLTDNKATTSVAGVEGMSKYVDSTFGFSFWYPTGWEVSEVQSKELGYGEGSIVKTLQLTGDDQRLTISELTSPTLSIAIPAGACGYCNPLTYFFDKNAHQWMQKYPAGQSGGMNYEQNEQSKLPKLADISKNTMGGLHMFSTRQKESAVIVPLSAKNFLVIKDLSYTEKCGSFCASKDVKGGAEYLARSIIASDKTVGTTVGMAEQLEVIKAVLHAYK